MEILFFKRTKLWIPQSCQDKEYNNISKDTENKNNSEKNKGWFLEICNIKNKINPWEINDVNGHNQLKKNEDIYVFWRSFVVNKSC